MWESNNYCDRDQTDDGDSDSANKAHTAANESGICHGEVGIWCMDGWMAGGRRSHPLAKLKSFRFVWRCVAVAANYLIPVHYYYADDADYYQNREWLYSVQVN